MRHEWICGWLCMLFAPLVLAHPAVVLSGGQQTETGQAFLMRYAGGCYAVLPQHVAVQQLRQGLRPQGSRTQLGELGTYTDLGDDVSVAPVSGIAQDICGISAFSISRAVDRHIRSSRPAVLRSVNADGTVAQMSVTIIDNDGVAFLRIQPTQPRDQIRKGASGSQLIVDGAAVGMLVSVASRSGIGKVVRQDALMSKVDRYFSSLVPVPASVAGTLSLVAWSSLPTGPDRAPANLVAAMDTVGAWRTAVQGKPVTLDFKINREHAVWSGVVLDARGVPEAELPSRVEVLGSLTGKMLGWSSILTVSPVYKDGIATVQFAPRRGQWIRLSISGPVGDAGTVSLRRIGVMEQPGK